MATVAKTREKPEAKKGRRYFTTSEKAEALGVIDERLVYPLAVFCTQTGIGRVAFAKLERDGLKVKRVGNRKFIRGSDWAEFLARK